MKDLKKIICIFLFVSIIFSLTGCSKKDLNMESKIGSEVEFCENGVLIFLKRTDSEEYKKDDVLDWDKISKDNKIFTDSIPTIEADLASVNFDNNKIEDIKTSVQNMNQYCDSKDINKLINEYAIFYNKIVSVKSTDNREFKKLLMNAYINALNNNTPELATIITEIENKYKNLKSNEEFVKVNGFSLRKINDNIEDLKNNLNEDSYKILKEHCLKIIEIM